MRSLHALLAALTAVCVAACKTTDSQTESAVKGDTTGLGTTLALAHEEGQSLYLKMLETELAAGFKVPKDQLHTSHALIRCQKPGDVPTCVFQSRLPMEDGRTDLSATQPVGESVAAKAWGFVQANRPDLASASLVLSDATCDYIGKQSPPYTVEDVTCFLALPRAPGEAVFSAQVAEDLGEALRGDKLYGNGKTTLAGSLSCQWLPGSPRTPCVVRAEVGGVLAEKLTELPAGSAAQAAKGLLQAVTDAAILAGRTPGPAPSALAAALTCLIDNTAMDSDGRRVYLCNANTGPVAGTH